MKIDRVLIAGGTHGNELTGVFLINHWKKSKSIFSRFPFQTGLLLSNPKAVAQGKRYVDKDLNRCFLATNDGSDLRAHEDLLARKIKKEFGSENRQDFVIDMHTSTSNMGITLMIEANRLNLAIADYVRSRVPEVNIYAFEPSERTQSCLRSLSPYAIGVEIGPVPQNLFCHGTIKKMETAVFSILEGIDALNDQTDESAGQSFADIYTHVENVPFPDEIVGTEFLVHEEVEKKSFQPLQKGDPIFINIYGEVIIYAGEENLCPVFVNEAAYYDKNIAFSLVKKVEQFDSFG